MIAACGCFTWGFNSARLPCCAPSLCLGASSNRQAVFNLLIEHACCEGFMVCPLTNASSARCVTQPTLKAKTTTTSKLSIRFRQLDEMSLIWPYLRERRKKRRWVAVAAEINLKWHQIPRAKVRLLGDEEGEGGAAMAGWFPQIKIKRHMIHMGQGRRHRSCWWKQAAAAADLRSSPRERMFFVRTGTREQVKWNLRLNMVLLLEWYYLAMSTRAFRWEKEKAKLI